jgi:hypothetical protein
MLLSVVILLLPCLTVQTGGAGVLSGRGIDPDCQAASCGTLYLLTDSDEEVGSFKGTHQKVKAKDVKKARVVGSGCFKIFKNRGHKGSAFLVKGSGILDLSEHGHTWTTVKSIQYSPDCEFPRRAGVEIYVIVCVVAVVLLVAIAAFTWSRFRKRRELSQVPTEDSA